MASQKSQKIDLTIDYPCPCRRRGRLVPIILTEAFGCNRCQQIFVVEDNGQVIEQLSTTYPYKRAWRWTGHRWSTAHPNLGDNYLPIAIAVILVSLLVWLPLALQARSGTSILLWAIAVLLVVVTPALLVWFAQRR